MEDISDKYEIEAVKSAPARAQSKLAKRYLDQKLAVHTQKRLNAGASSVAKAQVEAMSSDEYKADLDNMSVAIATSETSLAKMRAMELHHEYNRSVNSADKKRAQIL